MKIRLETCRPLVYKIGWLKAQGKDATTESAIAKYHVSESFVTNSLDAIRTFGALDTSRKTWWKKISETPSAACYILVRMIFSSIWWRSRYVFDGNIR